MVVVVLVFMGLAVHGQTPGALDPTFNTGSTIFGYVNVVVPTGDGKMYVGGSFTTVRGALRNFIARLNSDGTVDETFNPGIGPNYDVYSIAVQGDGKVLIGGNFSYVNGIEHSGIARLNNDGSPDTSFNSSTGATYAVYSIALQPDGKVLIGGDFFSYNGTDRNRIARLNSNGSLDVSFNPGTGADALVQTVALQADGKVLIGGGFTTFNGTARSYLARLNSNGSLDTAFNPGSGLNNGVGKIVVQGDGKALICGGFTSYNGSARRGIVRINGDGSLDTSFTPGTGANSYVYSLALQPDGKVLMAGAFTSINGTGRKGVARINSNGSLDTTFNPGTGADSYVYCIAWQADGKVLIGGIFSDYNGSGRARLARLNSDGGLDPSLSPGTGVNDSISGIAVQTDGKVLKIGRASCRERV